MVLLGWLDGTGEYSLEITKNVFKRLNESDMAAMTIEKESYGQIILANYFLRKILGELRK